MSPTTKAVQTTGGGRKLMARLTPTPTTTITTFVDWLASGKASFFRPGIKSGEGEIWQLGGHQDPCAPRQCLRVAPAPASPPGLANHNV